MEHMDSDVQPMSPRKIGILFVCMGNYCRSPALMAVLNKLAEDRGMSNRILVDSCGLTREFIGQSPDPRMVQAAIGLDLSFKHQARLLTDEDFRIYDLILAVDFEVLHHLKNLVREKNFTGKLALATSFSQTFFNQEMPDPYYGGSNNFMRTLLIAEDCCKGILDAIEQIKP